jgi:hypothetical protein
MLLHSALIEPSLSLDANGSLVGERKARRGPAAEPPASSSGRVNVCYVIICNSVKAWCGGRVGFQSISRLAIHTNRACSQRMSSWQIVGTGAFFVGAFFVEAFPSLVLVSSTSVEYVFQSHSCLVLPHSYDMR